MAIPELPRLGELAREPLTVVRSRAPEVFAQIEAVRAELVQRSLKETLGPGNPHLRRVLDELDFATAFSEQRDLKVLILQKLDEGDIPARSRARAASRLEQLEAAGELADPLDSDLPLEQLPLVAAALAQARTAAITQVAGLDPTKAAAVLGQPTVAAAPLDTTALRQLEATGTVTHEEAHSLGLAVSLYNLLDEDAALAAAVRPTLRSVRDLAAMQVDAWRTTLRQANVKPPDGTSIDDYATQLERRVASVYPTDALLARLAPGGDAVAARLEGMDGEQLTGIANTYPGLGIAALIEETQAPELAQRIAERIRLVGRLRDANPDAELLELDYSPDSPDLQSVASDGMSSDDRQAVLTTLRAYQRVHRMTGDPGTSQALLAAGYTGSAHVVRDGLRKLIDKTGLGEASARRVHENAVDAFANVTATMGTILDTTGAGPTWSAVANLAPGTDDYLKRVPGYAELFGSQTACRCEHCQSVLSPAAYFVDLMGFVEQHVLDRHFAGAHASDPLNLKVRRPDLWELPLTCHNTEQSVPTLDIINEILEDHLARRLGYGGPLTDRAAVEQAVYETGLSGAVDSFRQPFWLPLARLTVYLKHFKLTRWDVATHLGVPAALQAQAALELSRREHDVLVASNVDPDFLRHLYTVDFEFDADGYVTPFDAQALLGPVQVDRAGLGQLLATRFVRAGSAQPIEIRAEKTTPDSVQNDLERIHGLTAAKLDRLHRFTRLHAHLHWSVDELDLALTRLGTETLGTEAVEDLVCLRWVQQQLGGGIEELCALSGELPQHPVSPDGPSLFDRLFNNRRLLGVEGPFPQPGTRFVHPAFRTGPDPDPNGSTLDRLLAGLRVDDEALFRLIVALRLPLGMDPDSAGEHDQGFPLNATNLSLLYRHARLAEQLKLSITELFQLIDLAGPAPRGIATVHYRRPAGDYDDPASGSWGLHLWGEGLAPGLSTVWEAPMPRTRTDAYGATYDVPLTDPTQPVNFIVHFSGQNSGPGEVAEDRSFVPALHPEVWLRQGDPAVRFAPHISGLNDLARLLRFHQWWKDSGYSLDDLGLVTGGRVADPAAYPQPAALAADLIREVREDAALSFAGTVFAFLPDVTEDQSRKIVADNATAIAPAVDGTTCRLRDAYDPATALTVPGGVLVTADQARELLLSYHFSRVLPTRLASRLDTTPAKTRALLDIAGMAVADPALATALGGEGVPEPDPKPLVDLIAAVLPLWVAFQNDAFDVPALDYVRTNPGVFDISDLRSLNPAAVRRLSVYAALTKPRDGDFSTAVPPVEPADVRAILNAFTAAGGFAAADPATLARVLRVGPGLAIATQAAVTLPASAPDALDQLSRCASLAQHLGVGGDTLALIVAEDYTSLARAAAAVLAAFRARYTDEKVLADTLGPFEDRLRDARRDALVDYLIHSVGLEFASRSDLYHHFLIDLEFEGCARTTRVAAAIGSVQLYVHRILLNLEQDRRDTADPARTHVPPTAIPADEWTWRRNYRVWEANRKVFLYPENYLEPGLRDGKSPQFEALEESLLQRQVDDYSVIDAYATYLRGFEEVAKLQVAGAWCDRTGGADVLHLIGASSDDPPVFYHRTAENLHRAEASGRAAATWTAWSPIEVQIPVRRVAPVVYRGRMHLFWAQYTARPKTQIADGNVDFGGYQHQMDLQYTTLRTDGAWAPPQSIKMTFDNGGSAASIEDPREEPPSPSAGIPRYSRPPTYAELVQTEPVGDYGLRGLNWDVYPELLGDELRLAGRNAAYTGTVDLHRNSLTWVRDNRLVGVNWWDYPTAMLSSDGAKLYSGIPRYVRTNAWANMLMDAVRYKYWFRDHPFAYLLPGPVSAPWDAPIATMDPERELWGINGAIGDALVQMNDELLLVQLLSTSDVLGTPGSPTPVNTYAVRRMSTTLADGLSARLFTHGIDGLLATDYQLGLRERASTLVPQGSAIVVAPGQDLDYAGANGVYLREIFFHVPFLLANHLNSQRRYAAARRWFQYLFNPTASEPLLNDFRAVGCAIEGGRLQVCGSTAAGGVWVRSRAPTGTWEPAFTDMKAESGDKGQFTSVDCATELSTVHVCGVTADGRLWHTVRDERGLWQAEFGDVESQSGPVGGGGARSVACASDGASVHVCVATKDGRLLHTIRNADGTWQAAWDDVKALSGDPGQFSTVGCAVDGGFLHVVGATMDGRVRHNSRNTGGAWQVTWTDLDAHVDHVGHFNTVSCAADAGTLDIVGDTTDGRLWHTRRHPDGTWDPAWTDLRSQAGDAGRWVAVACATDESRRGELQLCGVTMDGRLHHTIRCPAGAWRAFDDGRQPERDRVWRYREFRGLEVPRLREILTDRAAIEAYRRDPFNPHAIARLRLSAYQKSVVMRYVDNLLDWGDSLFAEFTSEAVNEAALMYAMASDILGPPPADVGDCGEGAVTPRTYAQIAELLKDGSEFLIEAETLTLANRPLRKVTFPADAVLDTAVIAAAEEATYGGVRPDGVFRTDWKATTESWQSRRTGSTMSADDVRAVPDHATGLTARAIPSFGWSLWRQVGPAFCVPPNRELLDYWQRVQDRRRQIWNCQDIEGVRRDLAPYAAAIDPRILIAARAAGISLEDVLAATSGNLPPYRFSHLIERAKSQANMVQALGAALLSALEKRDGEELARLHAAHQQNLLSLGAQAKKWEVEAAQDAVDTAVAQKAAAEYRKDHYRNLLDRGNTEWELEQQGARHTASLMYASEGGIRLLDAVLYLIPQLGAPTAMKWGGAELGDSLGAFANAAHAAASIADAVSASAGLEAGFQRRDEDWGHQVELAARDVAVVDKQIAAATLAKQIAEGSLALHERTIKQAEEVFDLYKTKFTGRDLYTRLAESLQRLHREAFNGALTMARLAEQALRFERGDDIGVTLGNGHWDAARGGLLAGERLHADLLAMETRFLETNYRDLEVEQDFSLMQLDPAALVRLRQTGECEFRIPEVMFDLFYPGHYRRRISAVRLTIPAVTGPYVNVSATLTLLDSQIRSYPDPAVAAGTLPHLLPRRSVSIATSTAQADGGIFEMNFHDERYMPFEGQGGISHWRLTLPRTFRQFDYQTISDAILTMNYTARWNQELREEVERENLALKDTAIHQYLKTNPLRRLFSLRHDFPAVFQQLLHEPGNTAVEFEITRKYLPAFLGGRSLTATDAVLALRPRHDQAVTGLALSLDGTPLTSFTAQTDLGGLPGTDARAALSGRVLGSHELRVTAAGELAPDTPTRGSPSAFDDEKLLDVLLYVQFTLGETNPLALRRTSRA